jgi:hypothetical protein
LTGHGDVQDKANEEHIRRATGQRMLFEFERSRFSTNIHDLFFVSLQATAREKLLEEGKILRKRIIEEDSVAAHDLVTPLGFQPLEGSKESVETAIWGRGFQGL